MSFDTLIQTLGLPGLTLGTIAEGDAVAFLGGVLSHRGYFPPEAAALAVTLGAVIVDNIFFALGRRAGQGARVQHLLSRPAVTAFRRQLDRHATLAVLGFRYIFGMKSAGAALIGTSSIPWRRFAVLDVLGAALWAHLLVWIGYLAGHSVTRLWGEVRLHWYLAAALALFLAGAAGLYLWQRRR